MNDYQSSRPNFRLASPRMGPVKGRLFWGELTGYFDCVEVPGLIFWAGCRPRFHGRGGARLQSITATYPPSQRGDRR